MSENEAKHCDNDWDGHDLAHRKLGVTKIFYFAVAASAPMTVVGGGLTTTFAVTRVLGVPLSFVVTAVVLALFTIGYAVIGRYIANAGVFYAYLARGLGKIWGVAGAAVALLSYSAIQIGLYGLFGASLGAFVEQHTHLAIPWWLWAGLGLVVIAFLGLRQVDLNARVLAVFLILEVVALILFNLGAVIHPFHGLRPADGFAPSRLFGAGSATGAMFAFAIAAFVGFESGAIYSEESHDPRHTIGRATFAAVAFTGMLYAISAWSMIIAVGADNVIDRSRREGPSLLFQLIAEQWGIVIGNIANMLYLTSIFAAMLSFHNGAARYLFALGRERILPVALSKTSRGRNAPYVGSLVQTATAFITVTLFALAGRDPILNLFTWASAVSGNGITLLMAATSAAVVRFFFTRRTGESRWQSMIAPGAATLLLGAMTVFIFSNYDQAIGSDQPSLLRWFLPLLLVVAIVVGLAWGLIVRRWRPDIYRGIGQGSALFLISGTNSTRRLIKHPTGRPPSPQ